MADEEIEALPEHWRNISPEQSWKEISALRSKLAAERATAKQALNRISELEGLVNETEPKLAKLGELEANLSKMQSRLSMTRLGINDDDVAEVAEQRFARYQSSAGKDAKTLDAWLSDEGKTDRILAPLLQPAAAAPAAPLPPVPVVPQPTAPTRTAGVTADEVARIRAANNGRIPKDVQKDLGTKIAIGDLLGARR